MHKLLCLGVIIILIFTISLSAELKYGIAGYGTWSYIVNKDFNDAMSGNAQYTADLNNSTTSADQINGAFSGELELRVVPSEKFIIALIGGYIDLPQALDYNVSNQLEQYKFYSIPVSLGGYYVIPLNDKINIDLGLSVGIYLGYLNATDWNGANSQTYNFQADGLGLGLRIFSEYKLTEHFSVIGGIAGRYAKISGFIGNVNGVSTTMESYDKVANGKTYHVWNNMTAAQIQQAKNDPTIQNLKDAELDLSGFNIYLGVGWNI